MKRTTDRGAESTSLDPSKQPPTPQLVVPLERAWAPHPDFRSQPSTPDEEHFRHSGWQERRRLVWLGMQRCHLPTTRLDRFAECGSNLWVGIDKNSGELGLQCNCCHDRMCVPCGTTSAAIVSEQLQLAIDGKDARFMTLTRRHTTTSLKDQIDSLFACFNRLRERAFWLQCVKGGAYFIECKFSDPEHVSPTTGRKGTGCWHLHLHLIVVGDYVDQGRLSREWLAVTQDSSIVDVRKIDKSADVARYVTKYVTKPCDSSVYHHPDKLDEFIISFRGRRLCGTFGSWARLKLHGEEEAPRELIQRRNLATLLSEVRAGDAEAYSMWRAVILRWPGLSVFAGGMSDVGVGPAPPGDECPF